MQPSGLQTSRARTACLLAAALLLAALPACSLFDSEEPSDNAPRTAPSAAEAGGQGKCAASLDILEKLANGYYPDRSGDILAVEALPNQFGTRHSSPYPYTQDVPLLLYGPGYIKPGTYEAEGTVADLAPTFAELMAFEEFPERDGRVLDEALKSAESRGAPPKLIFTLVWDGGGDNLLAQWPDSWPNLKKLMTKSAVFDNVTVGSSPSITPAIHATIGTGSFPSSHGMPDIKIRFKGKILDAWEGASPRFLELPTIGDLWDQATGNEALVGALARDTWHLGMIGQGALLEGGDKDIAAMDQLGGLDFRTSKRFFSLPPYLLDRTGLEDAVQTYDQKDGSADGEWIGGPINTLDAQVRFTPAWPPYQSQKMIELLEKEGYGTDDTTDLFYTNYKGTDLAGHEWNLVDPEVREVLIAQDEEIPVVIDALDDLVGRENYVLAFTADHGMTPYPSVTGGWSINTREMTNDIEGRFNPDGADDPLILSHRSYQIMLERERAKELGVSWKEIAKFVNDYRLRDNVTSDSKELFEKDFADRANERLYLTALTPDQLRDELACAQDLGA
ncbi:MAG: alkaline phosphatase family protein [Actinomycetota bacterium]